MKGTIFRISGTATDGDVLVLNGRPPDGGQSNAEYFVKGQKVTAVINEAGEAEKRVTPGDTVESMVTGMVNAINLCHGFVHEHLNATAKGDLLVLSCSDVYSGFTWITEVRGAGTEKFEEL